MIEDEEWKDIHMEAPELILKTLIFSMKLYILNKVFQIILETIKICFGNLIKLAFELWVLNLFADRTFYASILCLNVFINLI